jgi:hypothetical protein
MQFVNFTFWRWKSLNTFEWVTVCHVKTFIQQIILEKGPKLAANQARYK